jgi:hypothetical protein
MKMAWTKPNIPHIIFGWLAMYKLTSSLPRRRWQPRTKRRYHNTECHGINALQQLHLRVAILYFCVWSEQRRMLRLRAGVRNLSL